MMRTSVPKIIEAENLSVAWGRALLHVMRSNSCGPLTVSIGGFAENVPLELEELRAEVDKALEENQKVSVQENAFTIFPYGPWIQHGKDSQWIFERSLRYFKKMKGRSRANAYGTYFNRMMDYVGEKDGVAEKVNQLFHLISIWRRDAAAGKRPRQSALQIACFDPVKDHTGQPVRGFPCLQQVSITYDNDGGLAVNAYYPTQYIFDRAYGNYVGLCHLGHFIAHEFGLKLVRLNCTVSAPELGEITKSKLRGLVETLTKMTEPCAASTHERDIC